ncbi:MAG: FTR1 family protein [Deltaproteobacteria bacterium]|nr:FTR1 family protein [Deltaproteobacteria bacterium]MBI3387687.1 FTR1 family protein [Deltaproteobacteria bacterium]
MQTRADQQTQHHPRRPGQRFARLLVALIFLPTLAFAAVDADGVTRVLTLLTVVGEEYREGCDGRGHLVRPLEYEEARSFLAEARMRWGNVAGIDGGDTIVRQLGDLTAAIDEKQAADTVLAQVATIRAAVTHATGIDEDIFPPQSPSPQRGAAIFYEHCASCHGEHGDGHGPDAARLERKPANFTDAGFMRGETVFDHIHVISVGKRGAAMPAWEDVLTLQERWDVLSYVWRLAHRRGELAEGQGLYLSQCASCHGAIGDGTGPLASTLLTPAPNFTQPARLARRTDAELFDAVHDGVAGTAMPAFGNLTDDERWKTIAFVRALSLGGPDGGAGAGSGGGGTPQFGRFGRLLRLLSAEYAKAVDAGRIVSPQDLTESEVLLGQINAAISTVAAAVQSSAPAVSDAFPKQAIELTSLVHQRAPAADVAKLVDAIVASLPTDAAPAAAAISSDPFGETRRLLASALAAYRGNDPQALSLVSDAYFKFEPFEKKLAINAPDLTRQVETRFLELRGVLAAPGATEGAAVIVAAIGTDLETAHAALAPHANPYALFLQSATIILREGFEIVLIITALLAYVKKSGNARMQRSIWGGTITGIALSLVTAFIFVEVLHGTSTAAAETLGGCTMLLAAVVLFWVSYWLVSKAEADKWQRFIQGKVKTALSTGSGFALAGAAFLAVYREGVETVLFYQALFGAASDASIVVGGLIAGAVALAMVSAVLQRFGMKIPIRQFFLGTSFLLYYMAIVFAGNGIAELQETSWIAVTPVAGVPRIDLLGLYPTVETLLAQGIFVLFMLYAGVVIWRRRRPLLSPADTLLAEVRSLHQLAISIRAELAQRSVADAIAPADPGQQLDTLIERVARLEGQIQLDLPARAGKVVGH